MHLRLFHQDCCLHHGGGCDAQVWDQVVWLCHDSTQLSTNTNIETTSEFPYTGLLRNTSYFSNWVN